MNIQGTGFSYEDIQALSKGSYGEVFVAVQKPSGKRVVLKKILKQDNESRVAAEVLAGHKLNGIEGIPLFHHYFETSSAFWLVFDYVQGKDLFQVLMDAGSRGMNEKFIKKLFKQTVTTLSQVHSKNVSHKDIKLENIMLRDEDLKIEIIDFGLCHHFDNKNDQCKDYAGSREYAAPELIFSYENFSSTAADVWSLGVTFFALHYGVFPFAYTEEEQEAMDLTGIHPKPNFPPNKGVSAQAQDLLSKMLEVNPAKRITLKEIEKHSYFKSRFSKIF